MPVSLSMPSLPVELCRQQCPYCLQRWRTNATGRYGQSRVASSPCNSQFCQYCWQNCDSGYCQQHWRNARSLRATAWRPRATTPHSGNPGSLIPEFTLARCVVPLRTVQSGGTANLEIMEAGGFCGPYAAGAPTVETVGAPVLGWGRSLPARPDGSKRAWGSPSSCMVRGTVGESAPDSSVPSNLLSCGCPQSLALLETRATSLARAIRRGGAALHRGRCRRRGRGRRRCCLGVGRRSWFPRRR